jgi:beta-lactamase class A
VSVPIAGRLRAIFGTAGVRGFLHAVDLRTGAEVGVDADTPVVSASVFKLPILVELYRRFADGRLDPQERIRVPSGQRTIGPTGLSVLRDDVEMSLRDLATQMMAVSDNTATDVVLARVGLTAVNGMLRELGLHATSVIEDCRTLIGSAETELGEDALSKLEGGEIPPEVIGRLRVLDPARTNQTTPRDCTGLLGRVWRDQAAPADACAEIRQVLSVQVWPHRLRSGFPARIKISGKTGTLPGIRNEAGVICYPDGGIYAVAVFTRAASLEPVQPAVDASIGAAARAAVEDLRCRGTAAPTSASG